MNSSKLFAAFCAVFLCAVSCAAGGKAQSSLETRTFVIHTAGGAKTVEAEIAATNEQRAAGLMFRTGLADGRGMLFVFERDEVQSFWMKNTLIPLSIAFILYDGTILEIKDMSPGDLSSVHSSRSIRYALEVPLGWFDRAGIAPGDSLDTGGL